MCACILMVLGVLIPDYEPQPTPSPKHDRSIYVFETWPWSGGLVVAGFVAKNCEAAEQAATEWMQEDDEYYGYEYVDHLFTVPLDKAWREALWRAKNPPRASNKVHWAMRLEAKPKQRKSD